jgi:single-stranded-DNA-specific exonuclease
MCDQLTVTAGRVRLAYRLDVNDYRGDRSAQLILEHIEAAP